MKKLEILIPQYKETEEIIKPLLDSIAFQHRIDFNDVGVIITNDGTDVLLDEKFLASYPFEIKYYKNEHKGVSATRNYCLDKSTAEYVMFCDADDCFCDISGLFIIFRTIKDKHFDAFVSLFREEVVRQDTGEVLYVNRGGCDQNGNLVDPDTTFVHGKVYRREYLVEKNIRWNDDLTIHEDSYFNHLALNLTKNVVGCHTVFYLWKWRDDSVCRHDPKYILKTYNNLLKSNSALIDQFLKRKKKAEAQQRCCSMVYDAFYTMNKKDWIDQENKEFRDATEREFKNYYLKYKKLFNSISEVERNRVIIGVRNRFFQQGMMLESITFNEWIKHIEEI